MTGVNRGVAYGEGMVCVGSFDGRLNALDAKIGKERWVTDTTPVRCHRHRVAGYAR
jgi:outer membrane protein assembly factor BamB